jgi:hypothetical protein
MAKLKEITARDAKRLLVRLYARFRKGEVTEAAASREAFLLNSIIKAIEVTELEHRLEKLETALSNG